MSGHTATRFNVRWSDGRYFVSIPNYNGGEVVDAASYDALSDSHAELVKALEVARDWMMVDIEHGDEEQFMIDLALVDAALATLTARKVG